MSWGRGENSKKKIPGALEVCNYITTTKKRRDQGGSQPSYGGGREEWVNLRLKMKGRKRGG